MDSLDLVLRRAFGVGFCIYGVKGMSEGLALLRIGGSRRFLAGAHGGGGLLLLLAGLMTALSPHHSAAACLLTAPAIGLLAIGATFGRRTSETIDLALLAAAFLYLATA